MLRFLVSEGDKGYGTIRVDRLGAILPLSTSTTRTWDLRNSSSKVVMAKREPSIAQNCGIDAHIAIECPKILSSRCVPEMGPPFLF